MYSGGATGQSSLLSSQFQQGSHNASLSTLFTYHQCFGSESARIRFLPGPNPQKIQIRIRAKKEKKGMNKS